MGWGRQIPYCGMASKSLYSTLVKKLDTIFRNWFKRLGLSKTGSNIMQGRESTVTSSTSRSRLTARTRTSTQEQTEHQGQPDPGEFCKRSTRHNSRQSLLRSPVSEQAERREKSQPRNWIVLGGRQVDTSSVGNQEQDNPGHSSYRHNRREKIVRKGSCVERANKA